MFFVQNSSSSLRWHEGDRQQRKSAPGIYFSPAAAGAGAFSEIHLLLTVSSQSTQGPMSGIHAGPACHPAHRFRQSKTKAEATWRKGRARAAACFLTVEIALEVCTVLYYPFSTTELKTTFSSTSLFTERIFCKNKSLCTTSPTLLVVHTQQPPSVPHLEHKHS